MKVKSNSEIGKAVTVFCNAKNQEKIWRKEAESAKAIIAGTFNGEILAIDKGKTLPIETTGFIVNIQRKEVSRVDLDALRLAHPEIVEKFTKEKAEYHFNAVTL